MSLQASWGCGSQRILIKEANVTLALPATNHDSVQTSSNLSVMLNGSALTLASPNPRCRAPFEQLSRANFRTGQCYLSCTCRTKLGQHVTWR